VRGVVVGGRSGPAGAVVLAATARGTPSRCCTPGSPLAPKAFSLGVRIEHLQRGSTRVQHGFRRHPRLGPAEYKFAHRRRRASVYTFCMCRRRGRSRGLGGGRRRHQRMSAFRPRPQRQQRCWSASGRRLRRPPLAGLDFSGAGSGRRSRRRRPTPRRCSGSRTLAGRPPSGSAGCAPTVRPPRRYRAACRHSRCRPCAPPPALEGAAAGLRDPDALLTGVETRSSSRYGCCADDGRPGPAWTALPGRRGAKGAGSFAAVDGSAPPKHHPPLRSAPCPRLSGAPWVAGRGCTFRKE
jgi:hypothetical protein